MANENRPIYVTQTRAGVYTQTGAVSYNIVTEVKRNTAYTGDIRDGVYLLNLFVNTIVDTSDAAKDTFSNYATLADLDLIPSDRASAIQGGSSKFRDSSNTIRFDSLSVAVTAAKVVRDTINNIVDTYLRVKNSFIGVDTHYFPYPEEVTSLRDRYIQSYTAGRDSRIAAEDAQEEAQVAYNSAIKEVEITKFFADKICALSDILSSAQTLAQLVGSKYKDTLLALIATAEAQEVGPVSTLTGLKEWLEDNSFAANIIHDTNFMQAVDSTSGTGLNLLQLILQSSYVAAQDCTTFGNKVGTLQVAADGKLSDLKEKQELKAAASQVEETALGTLAVYCPNLDPASL